LERRTWALRILGDRYGPRPWCDGIDRVRGRRLGGCRRRAFEKNNVRGRRREGQPVMAEVEKSEDT